MSSTNGTVSSGGCMASRAIPEQYASTTSGAAGLVRRASAAGRSGLSSRTCVSGVDPVSESAAFSSVVSWMLAAWIEPRV